MIVANSAKQKLQKEKIMKLSQVKTSLENLDNLVFKLPNGETIPQHFHVTEVGKITKNFIDCGGTIRNEEVVNFQLWTATDYDHRLEAKKLLDIIELSEKALGIGDHEIEVEYQEGTIGKFGLEFNKDHFVLSNKATDCLAKENCGVPSQKTKIKLAELQSACCGTDSNCC